MWAVFSDVVKQEFVKYFQKVFDGITTVQNGTVKTLDFTKDNIPQVTENYAYRGEVYPVVVVSSEGGQLLVQGFNDEVGSNYHEEVLGVTRDEYVNIGKYAGDSGSVSSVAVKFQPSDDFGLEQVSFMLANNGAYSHGDLTVNIYEGGLTPASGSLLASGTVDGYMYTVPVEKYFGFNTDLSMSSDDEYWIEIESDSESGYYGFVDTGSVASGKTLAIKDTVDSAWVLSDDKGLSMSLRGDTQSVLGGDVKVPILVQIAAKDIKTVDNIFDMLLLYTELAKRYEYSDFIEKHIKIESMTFGGDTAPRELAGNIQIYVKQFTVNVVGAWTYSVDKELLANIGLNVTTF